MTNRDTYDIEEYEKEQVKTGINIQVNTLVRALMESEPCLFFNKEENLMHNGLKSPKE